MKKVNEINSVYKKKSDSGFKFGPLILVAVVTVFMLFMAQDCNQAHAQEIITPADAMSMAWTELMPLVGTQSFVSLPENFTGGDISGFKSLFESVNPDKSIKTLTVTYYYDAASSRWMKFGYVIYRQNQAVPR